MGCVCWDIYKTRSPRIAVFNGLIVQANKGQWVIVVHEYFPVKNCTMCKNIIELMVLEGHPGFICRGNGDSSFPISSVKWRGSPFPVDRGHLYFCRFAPIGSIPDFTAYKACQTVIRFALVSMP